MRYIKILLSLLLIGWLGAVEAGVKEKKQMTYGFNFAYEYNKVNTGDLNKFLQEKGFLPVDNELEYYSLGVSFLYQTHSVIGIGLQTGKSQSYYSGKHSVLKAFGAKVNYAYDLCKSDKWLLAPNAGLQVNNYKLQLEKDHSAGTINDISTLESTRYLPVAEFGLQAMRKFNISYVKTSLGVRVNYNRAISTQNWGKLPEEQSQMPGIDIDGFAYAFTGIIEFDWSKMAQAKKMVR